MTRDELLARRAHLLPIYQNPDPAHELQHVEVETELDWIAERLKEQPKKAPEPARRRTWRDGKALAAGEAFGRGATE